MDSQGLLPTGESSVAIKAKESYLSKGLADGDWWIKLSPAYLHLKDKLKSIYTCCNL